MRMSPSPASSEHRAIAPHPSSAPRPLARGGLQVDRRTTRPGIVELRAGHDHVLKMHVGRPVRASCSHHRWVYTRGDLDIWPAGMSDVWNEEGAATSVMVRLPPALLRRAAEDVGRNPDRVSLAFRCQLRDPSIEHIAWALDAERRAGFPSGSLYTDSLGLALAAHLLGRYEPVRSIERGLPKQKEQRVLEYIEAHLDRDLSLETLAETAGLGPSHFKTLFRRSLGLPVHQYVIRRRVERAKALLEEGTLPLAQVALDAGFAHQSHMARAMRRVLGVTPAALRRERA